MALPLTRYRFTRRDYHRMAEAGILDEDARVELIDGEILDMSPIGRKHAACVGRLTHLFGRGLADAAIVWVQNPIQLGEHAEPQPDLALLQPRADFYAAGLPTSAAVLLVVEVADTSADYDRRVKAPLYARSGIPELWLVDLDQDHVTVYGDPTASGYAAARVRRRGEAVGPAAFPDLVLSVDEILG